METLNCFTCKIDKPLVKYKPNKRKYQIKAYKGMCLNCKKCAFNKAILELQVVRYDYEDSKFKIIYFKDSDEVAEFFNKEGGEY
jgi:hypothetical protein